MNFCRAEKKDIPELCILLEFLFTQEAEFKADYQKQSDALTIIINNSDIGNVLVARESGKIVGMATLLYTVSTALGGYVAILEDMVLLPQQRGLKIGRGLLAYAVELARIKNCKRITLLTDIDNKKAQKFYQHNYFIRSSMVVFRRVFDN